MCRGSIPRFFRTALPQSSSNARFSTFAFRVYGRSPAARTTSLQLRNNCNTKKAEIPDLEVISDLDGARPSFFATLAMEFRMCCLSGMVFYSGVRFRLSCRGALSRLLCVLCTPGAPTGASRFFLPGRASPGAEPSEEGLVFYSRRRRLDL